MTNYLVDAHNVLHANPDWEQLLRQSLNDARELLIERAKSYALARRDVRCTLVFDGRDVKSRTIDDVIFVRGTRVNQNADAVIKKIVRGSRRAGEWIVVSNDHEVAAFARRFECETLRAEQFLARLAKGNKKTVKKAANSLRGAMEDAGEKPRKVSQKEIDEYKKLFGLS